MVMAGDGVPEGAVGMMDADGDTDEAGHQSRARDHMCMPLRIP